METTTCILMAVFLLAITLYLYDWLLKSSNYWTSRGIPCVPRVLPMFGNTLSVFTLKDNLTTWSRKIYEKYDDKSMIGFYNMRKPTLMLHDPELIKTVLQSSFKSFQHNNSELDLELDPLLGRNIFFTRGQAWKDSRSIFVSTLSIKKLKIIVQSVEKACEKLRNYLTLKLDDGGSMELEAKLLFSRFTTEVAAGSVFSIDGHSFEDHYTDTLLQAMEITINNALKITVWDNFIPFIPILNKLIKKRLVPPKVDKYFRKIANDVEEIRMKDGVPRHDIFQTMLDLARDKKTSREYALSVAFSFFIEGYETSSLTASFMAYELAKNPEIQKNLRREINAIMSKNNGRLTYEAIQEMNYMEKVVYETLRLYSPGGHTIKLCTEKYRLEGSDGLSLAVEPETSVLIPTMGLHMDREYWENPTVFDPERFSKEKLEKRHKFVYLPFGEGPRACPGSRMGINQIKAAFAIILDNYLIEPSPKTIEPLRISREYALTNVVGGFWIRLKSLKNQGSE